MMQHTALINSTFINALRCVSARFQRLLFGGVPYPSSPAFLLLNPMTTFVRSMGTGVPPSLGESKSTADEMIRENPGLGAGEAPVEPAPEPRAGEASRSLDTGAGSVMNPVESS